MDLKKKVEEAYDASSSVYDERAGVRYVQGTRFILREFQIPENPIALDVACGTGISTFELIRQCGGVGEFYGIDISQGMIDKAKENAASRGIENVVFKKGDAEQLEFPGFMFDIVISNASFHWFPDKLKALNEMYRVLKPRGQVALWFNGAQHLNEAWVLLKKAYTRVCGSDPPSYTILPSLEDVYELFDSTEFKDVRIYSMRRLWFLDPSVFMRQRDAASSFWQVGLTTEEVEDINRGVVEEMTKLSTEKGFKLTRDHTFAYGVKPE
jgi:ubiquinone/menaquinone biosynthesis C-methylase UbiE